MYGSCRMACRCFWDSDTDNCAQDIFMNVCVHYYHLLIHLYTYFKVLYSILPRGTHSSAILQHHHWLPVNQNSNSPHWLITVSTPLSLLTCILFLATTSRHVVYALPTPICYRFLGSTQPLPPTVSASLHPQYGTHCLLAFTLVRHHMHSAKPTVSSRPSVPLSGSHKCLKFGLWQTLCTINDFIYLLTYLLVSSTM